MSSKKPREQRAVTAVRSRKDHSSRPGNWRPLPSEAHEKRPEHNAWIDCGWGRLIFAHTFDEMGPLLELLRAEAPNERDIAFYVRDPHVALSMAPQDIFLDPSHAYRLPLSNYRPRRNQPRGYFIRRVQNESDAQAINRIYAQHNMIPVPVEFIVKHKSSRLLTYVVAEDDTTGEIIGTVTGVDHVRAFNDPEQGASLWCLAVDSQATHPGVGETLVRHLAEHYVARGRLYLDLSVMHDNKQAIALYRKLGFKRFPTFCLKRKNPVNEKLYIGPQPETELNPYARIIIGEARRRGIGIEVEDAEAGLFILSHGGRRIHCRESLSDLTSAVAMTRCDDKALTHRLLARHGLKVPAQREAGDRSADEAFLEGHGRIVVKPARGEQGAGISVDIRDTTAMEAAIAEAGKLCDRVLLEEFCEGQDLRVIVIDRQVVAAAIRRPAAVVGNGRSTIEELINAQSRRRAAATGGESRIPKDDETRRCVQQAGHGLDSVLADGERLIVRKTANLHTGGTIHDVTKDLHQTLADAAVKAATVLDIPVVGFDFLVPAVDKPAYVIVEANERPGLANHEPRPTAERFVDLLFPQTAETT